MKSRMINKYLAIIRRPISEEVMFKVSTSLKIVMIPIITLLILFTLLWLILSMNLIFFEANGFADITGLQGAYYDHMSQKLLDTIHWIILGILIIICVGVYVSYLFLRPFRVIGMYCEGVVQGETIEYDQELFTDLRLLTSFSEYFFNSMENALDKGKFAPIKIMKKYQNIHKPVFEKTFFIQLFIILMLISVAGAVSLYTVTVDVYMDLVKLSMQHLKAEPVNAYFFTEQKEIFNRVLNIVLVLHMFMYIFLIIHFHTMLSRPAFAIFATMRTYIRGNFDARIHLIGSRYMRPQSIKINKYLEYVQKKVKLIKDSLP